MSFVDELAHALQVFRAAAGMPEPKRRAARPPAAPKPKRRRRRTSSPRVAVAKAAPPEFTAIATVTAAPAGTPTEKKCRPASAPRILGTGLCPGCRRRDQVLLDSSEGARCRVCNVDLPPPEEH